MVGPTGEVTAKGNTETGVITPVENPAGARRSAVPEGALTAQREYENAHRKIKELGLAYKPEFTGPYQGRYEKSKATGILSYLPFLRTPEGYGEFLQLSADLRNSVIKLITGAQMGVQEAQRIIQQIPTEDDKDEIWADKYRKTAENADFMLQMINSRVGQSATTPTQPGPAQPVPTPSSTDTIRRRLGLPPRGQ
jgi:hypothetical protein